MKFDKYTNRGPKSVFFGFVKIILPSDKIKEAIRRHGRLVFIASIVLIGLFVWRLPLFQVKANTTPKAVTRISAVSGTGGDGDSSSYRTGFSQDGRYMVFQSAATNLVAGDTNGHTDIFVYDRNTNTIERVSIATDGTQGNADSYEAAISADGRYVAYDSDATNLVVGQTTGTGNVFVYDRNTDTNQIVSVDDVGTFGNGGSYEPTLSDDARYVVFYSDATNLVAGDTNGHADIFVYDRTNSTIERVSIATDSTESNGDSYESTISADGRYVAFESNATNLIASDTNGTYDIFLRDRNTNTTTRISLDSSSNEANGDSRFPNISSDGTYVTFESTATNLVAGDTNGAKDVFIRDLSGGTTARISVADDGTQGNGVSSQFSNTAISDDNRYIVYDSDATNLIASDSNGVTDIFLYDRTESKTHRVSTSTQGIPGNGTSKWAAISPNGLYIMFQSAATNLVSGDSEGHTDVFVTNMLNTTVVSGTVYDTDGTTPLSSQSLKMAVGSNTFTATTDGSGNYTFDVAEFSPGDIATIWIDGGSNRATYVLHWGTFCTNYPNCTGINLVSGQVILDSRNTGYFTNTELASCDNDSGSGCSDTDIGFTSNSGTLTLTWSTNELKISSSSELRPGGDVSAQKLELVGTYTADNETLTLSGSGTSTTCTSSSQVPLCVNGGTFNQKLGTINYTSTSNTDIPSAITYYNIGVGTSSDSTATTYSLNGDTTVNGVLTVGNGSSSATDTLSAASHTLTLAGSATPFSITSKGSFSAGTGTVTYSGALSKVASATYNNLSLGSGTNLSTDVSTVTSGEESNSASVVDAVNGFAYYALDSFVGMTNIIKVKLSDNTKVDSLVLDRPSEWSPSTMLIDVSNGYLYVSNNGTSPGTITKINLRTFTRVGSLSFNGSDKPSAAAIDTTNGYAYYIISASPSKVIKVDLSSFSISSTLTLNSGDNLGWAAAIDPINSNLYIGLNTGSGSAGKIVKVSLSTFTRTSILTLSGTEKSIYFAIDAPSGYLYSTGHQASTHHSIAKVKLSTFTRVGTLALNSTELPEAMVIDQPNQTMYVSADGNGSNPAMVKVNLANFSRVSATTFNYLGWQAERPLLDQNASKLYFATVGYPSYIAELDLATMAIDTNTQLFDSSDNAYTSQIDQTRGYVYYALAYENDLAQKIVRVRLSDGLIEDELALDAADKSAFLNMYTSQLDETNGFLYVVGNNTPATIVKINVATMTRVGSITLAAGEGVVHGSAIDTTGGFLYLSTNTAPTKVIKINLSSFTETGAISLASGENYGDSMSIDTTGGFLYVGTWTAPSKVVKISLSSFTETDSITLGENYTYSSAIDVSGGYVYFGTSTAPGSIAKVNLSTFTEDDVLTLNSGENYIDYNGFAIDTTNHIGYVGTDTSPGRIVKVDLDSMTRLSALTGFDDCSVSNICEDYFDSLQFDSQTGYLYAGSASTYAPLFRIRASDIQILGSASSQGIIVNGNLTINGEKIKGQTYNPTLNISGNLTIGSNSKFTATSGTMSLGGNLVNNGTFTHNSGTVDISGSGTSTISGNAITFYNFTSSAAGKTIAFANGNTYTFNNTVNINGTSGSHINLQSDSGGNSWTANFVSAQTSSYLTVDDSACDAGSYTLTISGGTDNGTNGSCFIFSATPTPTPTATPTPTPASGGGLPPQALQPPTAPIGGFQIDINNGASSTKTRKVDLVLNGGPDAARMSVSNKSDLSDTGQEPYATTKKDWDLCDKNPNCPDGTYAVYAQFYTQSGQSSPIVSKSIVLGSIFEPAPSPIPTPPTTPKPSETPKPTKTPKPEKTEKPTVTPIPSLSPTPTPTPTPTACSDQDKKVIEKKIKDSYKLSKKEIMAQFHKDMRAAFDTFKGQQKEAKANPIKATAKLLLTAIKDGFNTAKQLAIARKKNGYQSAKNIKQVALDMVDNDCTLPFPIPSPVPPPPPVPTPTPIITPSPTPTPTPSPSPSPTISISPAPSPLPSTTSTPNPTITPTSTPIASPTPSGTVTPTPLPTVSPSPSPSGSPTPTVQPTPSITATPTPSVTLTSSPQVSPGPTASPSVQPSPQPSGSPPAGPSPSTTPNETPPSVSNTPLPVPPGVEPPPYDVGEWYGGGETYNPSLFTEIKDIVAGAKFDTEAATYTGYIESAPTDVLVPVDTGQQYAQAHPLLSDTGNTANASYVLLGVPGLSTVQNIIPLSTALDTFTELWLIIWQQLGALLGILGYRKKKNYWGVVYDSESKQPLSPVLVELIDIKTRQVAQRTVTDIWGKFGFLVNPGEFRIQTEKMGYKFPSHLNIPDDGMYHNLYFGQPVQITDTSQVVLPNIPMDPIKSMQDRVARTSKMKFIFEQFIHGLFWLGFAISIFIFAVSPGWINAFIITAYAIFGLVSLIRRKPRFWGRIRDRYGRNLGGLEIMLSDSTNNVRIIISRTISNLADGKFFLKATPGSYDMTISDRSGTVFASRSVTVSKIGVLNSDIII